MLQGTNTLTLIMLGFLENAKNVKYNICAMWMNICTFVDNGHIQKIYIFCRDLICLNLHMI